MYTEVLKFVPEYCSLLLGAWQEHGTPPTGSGFDFVVNAVWPEVVAVIDEKAAVIFAPGNPDTFHKVHCFICTALLQLVEVYYVGQEIHVLNVISNTPLSRNCTLAYVLHYCSS